MWYKNTLFHYTSKYFGIKILRLFPFLSSKMKEGMWDKEGWEKLMKKGTKLQEMILEKPNSISKHLGAKMYNHGILQITLEL